MYIEYVCIKVKYVYRYDTKRFEFQPQTQIISGLVLFCFLFL